ncbi:MAG: ABC transporter substrate-binding protein [Stenotrophomonas sp.]
MALLLLAGSGMAGVPQRVVSLDLCTDWILGEHADKGQVAGLSAMGQRFDARYGPASGWPSHDGSLEQVVALRPDLVLVGPYNASGLRQRLQALGVRVEVTPLPTTLEQVAGLERQVLGLLGGDPARAHPVLPMPALAADAPRLLVLGANGVGTGLQTFENEVIARAGWRNYLAVPGYVRLDMEALVADPPDAILWAAPTSPAKANAFAGHRALLAVVPPPRWLKTDNWRWECPGPWTWTLVEQLQQWRRQ